MTRADRRTFQVADEAWNDFLEETPAPWQESSHSTLLADVIHPSRALLSLPPWGIVDA